MRINIIGFARGGLPSSNQLFEVRNKSDRQMESPKQSNSVAGVASQSPSAGEGLNEDELELHLWQKAYFLDDGSSARHAADSLRMRLAHLHYCCQKE